jgi:putative ABC transport system ATP-binding protein
MNYAIELKNITFSYEKNNPILNIPSLNIKYGEKIFIYGPSGSGKSTLLNLLAGITRATSGSIEILSKNFDTLSIGAKDRFRGDHIGFIFQSFNLISYLTIYENILLPLKASPKKNSRIQTNIYSEIERISSRLDIKHLLNKRVTELSVGQQQRVAVARALIGDSELIIADEPTSSLDEDVTNNFMKLLIEEQKKRNFTLIFVSHDRRLSTFFDKEISLSELNRGTKND